MTNARNKEYNFLKSVYESDLCPLLWKNDGGLDYSTSHFIMNAMELLEEYHILDIQYKARIKTLKEIMRAKDENN